MPSCLFGRGQFADEPNELVGMDEMGEVSCTGMVDELRGSHARQEPILIIRARVGAVKCDVWAADSAQGTIDSGLQRGRFAVKQNVPTAKNDIQARMGQCLFQLAGLLW